MSSASVGVGAMTQRRIVLGAMRNRPQDPWPRGEGHVPLGVPGSPREQKAYHEPGGSFSPSPGSFGVSIWVVSPDNRRLATSDDIPLRELTQHYDWSAGGLVPALATETPYYECRWSLEREACWRCELRPKGGANRMAVLIRSAGPSGGPVESLHWDGRQLVVNHRWVVEFEAADATVSLGDEDQKDWSSATNQAASWESSSGWGCARIRCGGAGILRLTVRDTAPWFASPLACSAVKSALELDLPDADFVTALDSQAANLLMGFVGRQTCPGEPTNYPLAWERDGAYSVVAMARAGHVDTAKQLAIHFAENDYFGGFGAEGDAPGSAINALVAVALMADDAGFQKWLWPHVRRKAGLIYEMLAAKTTLRKTWVGPIVPEHADKDGLPVICNPAENGLIVGNMDLHFPVLYINAFSFRGLRQAARLAELVGARAEAQEFNKTAEEIRRAWLANFSEKRLENERTFMSALWPTWIIGPDHQPFQTAIQERWERIHKEGQYPRTPLWTYFTVAEAHQWLFLDRPDNTWKTIRYFRENQCSPGLHTYWEGNREENSFGLWEHIRGWVKPKAVTPHYWTAAEMLLLQIDMLAYLSEAGTEPALVIGAGVPPEWIGRPMRVKGVRTTAGAVDWSYKDGRLEVTIRGKRRIPIRAGSSFGKGTRIAVHQGRRP
ncbi:MAG: hypothetical protein ABSE73_28235 [Planctomycetota bacterium]